MAQGQGARRLVVDQRPALHPRPARRLRRLGADGLRAAGSLDDVLPYFQRAEHQERGADECHGVGGPLNVSDLPSSTRCRATLIEACVQAGIPRSKDINAGDQEGATWFQVTIRNGKRHSAAVGYLHPVMGRPNLRVETKAHDGPAAVRGQARRRRRIHPARRDAARSRAAKRGDPRRRRGRLAAAPRALGDRRRQACCRRTASRSCTSLPGSARTCRTTTWSACSGA